MTAIHHIFFSFLCIFNVLLLAESPMQTKNQGKHIKITPLYVVEIPENIRKEIPNQQSVSAKKKIFLAKKTSRKWN